MLKSEKARQRVQTSLFLERKLLRETGNEEKLLLCFKWKAESGNLTLCKTSLQT